MVGREVSVLFERPGRFDNQMVGKSEYLHAVHVRGDNIKVGDIHRVRITKSNRNSLDGVLAQSRIIRFPKISNGNSPQSIWGLSLAA